MTALFPIINETRFMNLMLSECFTKRNTLMQLEFFPTLTLTVGPEKSEPYVIDVVQE